MPKSKHISNIHKSSCSTQLYPEHFVPSAAQAGFWELDVETEKMCWSLMVRAIFEVPESFEPTLQKTLSFCPNLSEKQALQHAIKDAIAKGKAFELSIQVHSLKGEMHTLNIMGKPLTEQGKTKRIYGSIQKLQLAKKNNDHEQLVAKNAEQAMEILDALPDLLFEVDDTGNILCYHAPKNTHLFPTQETMVGRNIAGVLEQGDGIVIALKECLRKHKSCRNEFVIVRKGQTFIYEARVLPVNKERGLLLIRDITNTEKENQEIKENEQKYLRLLENIDIGLMEVDEAKKITDVHPAFCRMTGYSKAELVGEKISKIFLSESEKIKNDMPKSYETTLIKKTGELLDVVVSGAPIYSKAGTIIGKLSIVHDITAQKRNSRLLEESNRIGKIGMFEMNVIQNKITWNAEMHKLYETPPLYEPETEEVYSFLASEHDREKAKKLFDKIVQEKGSYDEIFEINTKKANRKWIRMVATSEFHENKAIRIFGIAVDVTKMVEYERELEAHADLSDTILSSIQDGFYVLDDEYKVSFINESGASYIGRDRASLLGENIWEVFPEAIDLFYDAFERAKKTKQPEQMTHCLHVGGVGKWFNIKLYPTRKGGISVFYRDVSKEKEAEESIRNLNDRYSAISAATNQIIYEWNLVTQHLELNEVYYHVTGHPNTPDTKTGEFNLNLIHPEDRKRINDTIKECFEKKKTIWSGIYRFKIADGSYRNMHSRGIIRYSSKNEPLRILGTIEDITERTLLNEKLIREQVGAQRKINEAVMDAQEKERAFIGRELHDNVNQILTTASLYLELAESESFQSTETIHQIRALIRKGIEEIRMLSRQLTPPILNDIGLSVAIRDLVSLVVKASPIHFSVNMGADIVHELSNEKSLVLYRICQELLNNVIKYSGAINCFIILEKTRKKHVRLIVKDDGKGFDTSTTIKGIGLNSTVARVEIYGGSFQINSSPGKGCMVMVEIPL